MALDVAGTQAQKWMAGDGTGASVGDPLIQSIEINGVTDQDGLAIKASSINIIDFSFTCNGSWQHILTAQATRKYMKIQNIGTALIGWAINDLTSAKTPPCLSAVTLYPGGSENSDGSSFHHGDVWIKGPSGTPVTVFSDVA
jgi:hypothetical protein